MLIPSSNTETIHSLKKANQVKKTSYIYCQILFPNLQ